MKLLTALSLLSISFTTLPVSAQSSAFDLDTWKKNRGTDISLPAWVKENPSPYRSYFPSTKVESMKKWYLNLGPIGTRNLMHDRTWASFPACSELFPKALSDEHGLVYNNYEVVAVRENSPASGILEKGDYIVALNGEPLKSAQHMFLDRVVDNKQLRGLDIHAGSIIDKAEASGELQVAVLRLPDSLKDTPIHGLRKWDSVKKLKASASTKTSFSIPLGKAELVRIATPKKGKVSFEKLIMENESGDSFPVITSGKRESFTNTALEIPAGNWKLVATLEANKDMQLTIETMQASVLPEHLKKHLKKFTLKLDAIGSFGESYDPESAKVKNYTAMLAHRLATQQDEDGSWNAKSYASQSFYTSIVALALMSTEDPKYDDHIKRAAYYVAHAGERDKWTYSNGMWLVFLAEYYLKTQDPAILPALKMHVANCRRFVMSDYTSGHSYGQPGYGGSGYIGGGGVLSLGFAIASHTPAMNESDLNVLDKMLSRVQEIAPQGKVPYGRSGKSMETTYTAGQSGSCGTGPYYLASLIRGGAPMFVKNATKRYSTAPFGSAENGHATQTLHFVWACLSTANCGPEAHRQNMNDYLWKFAMMRDHDGFVNQNGYRVEYHNGDGVIGDPYWRSAGYLLILNSHKRNLAITGNPKYRAAPRELPVVFHRHRATYNGLLRNWALVEAYLGDKAPAEFTTALAQLRAIKPSPDMGKDLQAVLKQHAPAIARKLLSTKNLPKELPAGQIIELIMGISFEASCNPDLLADEDDTEGAGADKEGKKEAKKLAKKKQKLLEEGKIDTVSHRLMIRPLSRVLSDPDAMPDDDQIASALFKMENLTIKVHDASGKYLKQQINHKADTTALPQKKRGKPDPSEKSPDQLAVFDMKVGTKDKLLVNVSYTLDGLPISYTTSLEIPAPEARNYVPILCRVPVRGSVVEDYADSYSPLVRLETGQVVGCEQRNSPAPFLLAGAKYEFQISPGSVWGHDLRAATALTPDHRVASVSSAGAAKPGLKLMEGEKVIIYNLDNEQTIQRVYIKFSDAKQNRIPHTLEAMVDGKWLLLRKGQISGMMPTIELKTKQVRLTLEVPQNGARLDEVKLITPAVETTKPSLSW